MAWREALEVKLMLHLADVGEVGGDVGTLDLVRCVLELVVGTAVRVKL